MGDLVALPGEYPQSEDTERKGGPMSIIEMPIETAMEWYNFLRRPDVTMGYAAFIRWALHEASQMLVECNDDGDDYCMTHDSRYVGPYECEARQSAMGEFARYA